MAKKLSLDTDGNFRPYLGRKEAPSGKFIQHRFNLGRDLAEARRRFDRLARVWEIIENRWAKEQVDPRPLWDDVTLAIGRAIAEGAEEAAVPVPSDDVEPGDIGSWLRHLQQEFPFVKLVLLDRQLQEQEEAYWDARATDLEAKAKEQAEHAKTLRGKKGSTTLFQALDAYSAWVRETYVREGQITGTGISILEQVRELKAYGEDCLLLALDGLKLNSWVRHWANRPIVKRSGKPCAVDTARDLIKRIRHFAKWLNSNSVFPWHKPNGFEWERVHIATTPEENAARANGVQRFKVSELATIWQYATPQERLYIVLGLNCGFGRGELGTLQLVEVDLEKRLIKRLRTKTAIFGKWRLWDVTVAGIRWYIESRRSKTNEQETALLVNRKGKGYLVRTAGGNKNNQIYNAFEKVLRRIKKKDHPEFPPLSFNKLRKTSANLIRHKFGGEIAEVFLSHKALGKTELGAYTNSPYKQVFRAIGWLGALLDRKVFTHVDNPWHSEEKRPSISLETIKQIQSMRRNKCKAAWIAKRLGVSVRTVYAYTPRRTKHLSATENGTVDS